MFPETPATTGALLYSPLYLDDAMAEFQIYHNPRCSKSRNTLALLQEHGVQPEVILYLETPPDRKVLQALLAALNKQPSELVRRGEADYKEAGLSKASDEAAVLDAMVAFPKLIERPIVVAGERAILGRPPENVLELINK
ncbi:arsenate reductase [Halioglobus pacificus]|uniref:Arsenate reductase n=2 Tax=Parahalioglobus pacificus TaxID=930806 RepID=A0A918XHJ9_9GAMM|nr:arsenate reductase [Halioglobus pacificus]